MTSIHYTLLSIVVYYMTEIRIFSSLAGLKLPVWKRLFLLALALFFNQFTSLSPLMIDPFLFFLALKCEKVPIFRLKTFFLAFGPSVFVDLFSRFIEIIIIPYLFASHHLTIDHMLIDLIAYLLIFPSFSLIHYFLGEDYRIIFQDDNSARSRNVYLVLLIFMIAYYVDIFMILGFTDPFLHFEYPIVVPTSYKLLFLIFTLLLIYLLSYFNHKSKEYLKTELRKEQQGYMANLEMYGKHLEKLYKDVRVFQMDYLNRLDRLGQAIDSGSVRDIQAVYAQTLHDATDYWDDKHYNIAKLGNIKLSAIKSLLSSKVIGAEKAGICLSLEVPDVIEHTDIAELDLLLLLSIFCDNAREAALETDNPRMSIAYFLLEQQQVFVITNSTREEKLDIAKLFEEGYSSKGSGRGIGLSNARRILTKYPNISLATKSSRHQFSQTLTISQQEGNDGS